MGEYFLFIAKDTVMQRSGADSSARKETDTVETPKLRAFQKKVQLGQTIGPNVVVKSGINVGDRVVVDGVQAIHEGSPINAGPARQPGDRDSTGNRIPVSSRNK
jgi:membrane fusion protein (multidrug efflux system)